MVQVALSQAYNAGVLIFLFFTQALDGAEHANAC